MSTEHLPNQGSTSVPEQIPVQDVVPPAPAAEGGPAPVASSGEADAAEPAASRVRLNPAADPSQFKAVPSLNPGESSRVDVDKQVEEQVAREQKTKVESAPQRTAPVEIPRTEALEGDLEAELNAALQSGEVASAIAEISPAPQAGKAAEDIGLSQGTKVSGTIQSVHADDVFIDIKQRIPGVVSLPHGWGHSVPGTRMALAAERPGANLNAVLDERLRDPLSGNAVLSGVPVSLVALPV